MKLSLSIFIFFVQATLYSQKLEIVQPVRFLALGDSYTSGIGVDPAQTWPNQLFARLAESGFLTDVIRIIAQAGWTTDDLAEAIRQISFKDDSKQQLKRFYACLCS
jgi:hypothetical protein